MRTPSWRSPGPSPRRECMWRIFRCWPFHKCSPQQPPHPSDKGASRTSYFVIPIIFAYDSSVFWRQSRLQIRFCGERTQQICSGAPFRSFAAFVAILPVWSCLGRVYVYD